MVVSIRIFDCKLLTIRTPADLIEPELIAHFVWIPIEMIFPIKR